MQLIDDRLLLSASDLINFLECRHLTWLDLQQARGQLDAEPKRADTADLVARKGDEHEQHHLEQLRAQLGEELVEIDTGRGYDGLVRAAERTRQAMADGARAIYQATFLADGWRGHADFLERVDGHQTDLGPWGYEVMDTKLARSVKPYFILQLCVYSDFVAQIQGVAPQQIHVLLGTGELRSFPLHDFAAYHRSMRRHFEAALGNGLAASYPYPVSHCGLCKWSDLCDARRTDDDHLSLVARASRAQVEKLEAAGVATMAGLARLSAEQRPAGIGERPFERLRQQARLQVDQRETGVPSYELLAPDVESEGRRGFELLPRPSDGDVFFDIEGDPFYEEGLEYLWGMTYLEDGRETFSAFWGRDRAEEKQAFEAFIDFVVERRRRHPDMHVYHYAQYEPTVMKRLMGLHATREDEVDQLLRQNVLVDLYRVVEQSMRISQPSYSIKKVEAFYMGQREAAVTDGEDSILKFEEWLDTRDQALLDWIEEYNAEDCHSTLLLRDWLLERRTECEQEYGAELSWRPAGEEKANDASLEASAEVMALQRGLLAGVSDDPDERSEDEASRWLLSQLIDYHRRDEKPAWWEYFSRLEKTMEELETGDSEALAGLVEIGEPVELPKPKLSLIHRLSFPTQEHKISDGTFADPFSAQPDPDTGELNPFSVRKFSVERVVDEDGVVEIRRATASRDEPLPGALIPSTHYNTEPQRAALREIAARVIEDGLPLGDRHRAARAILARARPQTDAVPADGLLQDGAADLNQTTRIVLGLRDSYLFIQGPPGSGKTYAGAQLILSLLQQGKRVGVAANSHKAIHNLLHEVEKFAPERDVEFKGLQKHSGGDSAFESKLGEDGYIETTDAGGAFPTERGVDLMAGTAWLWCRKDMRDSVDYLVIDEAGQVSLADALAMATAARNVVLLGDPLQLAQVSQGAHPPGSGCSVLEHLLGDDGTVPPDRGVFLDKTRRMHPDVCDFVSHAIYAGRLSSIDECARQHVECEGPLTGTGVRKILLAHEGNTRQSPEEAERIATAIAAMLGGQYTEADGSQRDLVARDFMVVTPYNSQVRCLRTKLDAEGLSQVPAGTVDKFQGQEAAVVFFSLATSSGEDMPRNVEFLYSRNRLNVAVSRARCLAVLVCSPALLTIRCRSVEQMRLVNALCLLAEMAP